MTKSLLTGWNWQIEKTFKNRAKRIIPFREGKCTSGRRGGVRFARFFDDTRVERSIFTICSHNRE